MLEFICHDRFQKEIADLNRRFRASALDGFESLKKLFEVQFHPTDPRQIIGPGKIHRISQNDIWAMWKVEMIVKGLRPNHFPRVWFAVKGSQVAFLCIVTHIDNYDDNEQDRIALQRVSDVF